MPRQTTLRRLLPLVGIFQDLDSPRGVALPVRARGPAIVEEALSTTVVPPGASVERPRDWQPVIDAGEGGEGDCAGTTSVDPVTLTVTANYLVTVSREMGQAMQNTAYSPIFNEALDFSCAVFDDVGDMIGQGEFCPAQLGATTMALPGSSTSSASTGLGTGDVVLHNDPVLGDEPPARAHGREGGLR